jgi:DNA-binding XRE family transcriptional regulator
MYFHYRLLFHSWFGKSNHYGRILRMDIDARKVRQLRESKGMSTRVLAREAGISTETLNAIEHSRRQVQVRTLAKLARALGVEVRDLF